MLVIISSAPNFIWWEIEIIKGTLFTLLMFLATVKLPYRCMIVSGMFWFGGLVQCDLWCIFFP